LFSSLGDNIYTTNIKSNKSTKSQVLLTEGYKAPWFLN